MASRFVATFLMLLCVGGCKPRDLSVSKNPNSSQPLKTRSNKIPSPVNRWTSETKIGQIVAERPQTARVFELVGVDYCCGGGTPLATAAAEKQIDMARLLNALLVVGSPAQDDDNRNWQTADLGELMDHIVARHHAWLRRELPPLIETTNTVFKVHGEDHSELKEIAEIVERVQTALLPHLDDEEKTVFPAVKKLVAGEPSADAKRLLEEMKSEHDELGADLHRIHELTNGFAVPTDACAKYKQMLTGLQALEDDMHTHVHLENNVLLPRALELFDRQ